MPDHWRLSELGFTPTHSTEGLNDSDKNMKHFIKENWFKIGALILLLVAACAVSYYYLVFKPEQDQAAALQQMVAAQETATAQSQANDLATAQAQQAQTQAAAKKQQLEDCVNSAHQDYVKQGQFDCENAGYTQTQIDNGQCMVPYAESHAVLQAQTDAETLCATFYK